MLYKVLAAGLIVASAALPVNVLAPEPLPAWWRCYGGVPCPAAGNHQGNGGIAIPAADWAKRPQCAASCETPPTGCDSLDPMMHGGCADTCDGTIKKMLEGIFQCDGGGNHQPPPLGFAIPAADWAQRPPCAASCTTAPTTCEQLGHGLSEGGCAASCTVPEKIAAVRGAGCGDGSDFDQGKGNHQGNGGIAIPAADWAKRPPCAASCEKPPTGCDSLDPMIHGGCADTCDDTIKKMLEGIFQCGGGGNHQGNGGFAIPAADWAQRPQCAASCTTAPTTCEQLGHGLSEGGCAASCTVAEKIAAVRGAGCGDGSDFN